MFTRNHDAPTSGSELTVDAYLGETYKTMDLHAWAGNAAYFMVHLQISGSLRLYSLALNSYTERTLSYNELTTANMPFNPQSLLRAHYVDYYGTRTLNNYILVG